MPAPIFIQNTINIPDSGGKISVVITVGFAKQHEIRLDLLNDTGVEAVVADPAKNGKAYAVGTPAQLLKGRQLSCSGAIGRSSTTEDPRFSVVCAFFQGSTAVPGGQAVQGKFGTGDVRQDFVVLVDFV